ncbi:hypothetical protein NL676_006902 [Syzygium grande]|nr:hypothetical protein NL676_006902 [Syzygium grande]
MLASKEERAHGGKGNDKAAQARAARETSVIGGGQMVPVGGTQILRHGRLSRKNLACIIRQGAKDCGAHVQAPWIKQRRGDENDAPGNVGPGARPPLSPSPELRAWPPLPHWHWFRAPRGARPLLRSSPPKLESCPRTGAYAVGDTSLLPQPSLFSRRAPPLSLSLSLSLSLRRWRSGAEFDRRDRDEGIINAFSFWAIQRIAVALCSIIHRAYVVLTRRISSMGGACSRKRNQQDDEDVPHGGVSSRYSKSASSKWLSTSFSRSFSGTQHDRGKCPSLMDLCVQKITEDIGTYRTFSMLPRDITQLIFNELVFSQRLTNASLEAFRDCALQDLLLGEYPGVDDKWLNVISSQGSSLLSVDLSGSEVSDDGVTLLKDCTDLQSLNFNYCDRISDLGVQLLSGLSNLTALSFRRNDAITSQGMSALAGLVNLAKLDLERCPKIHGGLIHLEGLSKLESLNIKWCNSITDADMKPLSGLKNLKSLQLSCSKITDNGIMHLKGLHKLSMLNLEGCPVTAACLDSLAALSALLYLNLNRCRLTNEGCGKFSRLGNLKVLNLGFNDITDGCLVHLRGLRNLESLNLDSCRISDGGLVNLADLRRLKCLELSDTEVGSNGLHHLSGLTNLESINLSFTAVTDGGLRRLSGLSALKSLNLDVRLITDTGLTALTGLTGLTHLDLFGARITDSGTTYLRNLKKLQSLEICGGGLTDAGMKNIKDLSSLTLLNLSQNCNLTDKTLELVSGLTGLVSLNVSNSRVTSAGLRHLKTLKNLRSLTLEGCKLTGVDIKKLQSTDLPNLVSFRPE